MDICLECRKEEEMSYGTEEFCKGCFLDKYPMMVEILKTLEEAIDVNKEVLKLTDEQLKKAYLDRDHLRGFMWGLQCALNAGALKDSNEKIKNRIKLALS